MIHLVSLVASTPEAFNAVNFVDPFGLDSIFSGIGNSIGAGALAGAVEGVMANRGTA